ncbi:MAG: hypothetical protein JST62_03855, partial [Bacteroidetes bacterium]|nr:hypothetical protein [Bacteroidota bacterium]
MIKHNPIFNLLLLLICYLPMKAQNYYDQQWKSIENNYKKGQYKSNLPLILEIQKKAVQENNMVQLIKSLKSEFSIINTTDDDTQNNTASVFFKKIQSFENQLKGNDQLVYQVLSKNFVMDYFNQNSWKIQQNTNLDVQNLETIETWTTLDFKNYLSKKFLSLENQNDELRKIDFSPYQSIFSQTDFQKYFPKIADYNALQYIDFLKNDNFFTQIELKTNQQKVISLEKQLINDNSGNGRLYFENLKLNDECEFNKCKNILAEKIKLYNSTTQGDYKVLIADDIIGKLQSDKKLIDAMDWIKKVKKEYPKSEFINTIINRENGILQPELNINYENTTLANKPIHIVANYKNANTFSINIYDASSDINGYINYINNNWENNSFDKIIKTLVKTEKFVIPKTNDYKSHSTSYEIAALPPGLYLASFEVDGNAAGKYFFLVSNSRIIRQNISNPKNPEDLQKLVDRNSGENLANTNLEIYYCDNKKSLKKYTITTDKQAVFQFPKLGSEEDYFTTFLVKEPKTNQYNITQNNYTDDDYSTTENNPDAITQLFTDRSIYRPGQTVYFKG